MTTPTSSYILTFAKGVAMGAADVIPGVSGGTVAFVTGIYEELIHSIANYYPGKLWTAYKENRFIQHLNLPFLLPLGFGILCSLLSLAHFISQLLKDYPNELWSFFFGLIAASAIYMSRSITRLSTLTFFSFTLGFAIAVFITIATPTTIIITPINLFLSGFVSICAMILPGLSGAFILLLLGMYAPIIDAVKSFSFSTIFIFASGCLCGLICFSNVLKILFQRHPNATLAMLTGFMLGSLGKVWPWKIATGATHTNVLPSVYAAELGIDPQVWTCGILISLGFSLIFIVELGARKLKDQ